MKTLKIGNKKISSTTGKEEVFDTPVPTVTGEDVMSTGQSPVVDLINPLEAKISRSSSAIPRSKYRYSSNSIPLSESRATAWRDLEQRGL